MTAKRKLRLTPLTKIIAELYSARWGLFHASNELTDRQWREYRKINTLTHKLLKAENEFRELARTA